MGTVRWNLWLAVTVAPLHILTLYHQQENSSSTSLLMLMGRVLVFSCHYPHSCVSTINITQQLLQSFWLYSWLLITLITAVFLSDIYLCLLVLFFISLLVVDIFDLIVNIIVLIFAQQPQLNWLLGHPVYSRVS